MSKKILMLSSRIPYPLTAGFRIRIFNEAKYFKKNGYQVDLLFMGSEEEYQRYRSNLHEVFDGVFFVPLNKLEVLKNLTFGLFSQKPLQVALYQNKRFAGIFEQIRGNYDYIIGNHIRTAEYLEEGDIVDLHDAISYNYANVPENESFLKKPVYRIEQKRVLAYESECCQKFSKLVIVSQKDKEWLEENGADVTNLHVIPVAVRDDIPSFKEDYGKDEMSICFLGKLSYQPNEDAVCWFIEEVMPALIKKYPGITFHVLGIEPTKKILSYAKDKHVHVTGFLENPYQIMSKAKATVVPIRNGAGVQNKVLESMLIGTPVVASEIAAGGIDAKDDEQLMIAKNKEEFIEKISALFESEEKRRRIGKTGQKYIQEHYSWDALWHRWNDLIVS